MERNRNIDIVRALSILLIVVYHIYAITNVKLINNNFKLFLQYGGEYGVTVFFMISGFSIYKSLSRRKDNFKYKTFIIIEMEIKKIIPIKLTKMSKILLIKKYINLTPIIKKYNFTSLVYYITFLYLFKIIYIIFFPYSIIRIFIKRHFFFCCRMNKF